jgi:hypothetical protein
MKDAMVLAAFRALQNFSRMACPGVASYGLEFHRMKAK